MNEKSEKSGRKMGSHRMYDPDHPHPMKHPHMHHKRLPQKFMLGRMEPHMMRQGHIYKDMKELFLLTTLNVETDGLSGTQLQEMHRIPRGNLMRSLTELEKQKLIVKNTEKIFKITEKGQGYLEELKEKIAERNMIIRLLKRFTVGDALGKEMDASALVTVLAEVFLVPSYALQPYVKWQSIDDNSAGATLIFNETKVSAVFHFNSLGEMIRIDTDDRYFTEKDGTYTNVKWSGLMSNYIKKDGIKFPSEFKGVWHFNDGDFEYFLGKISNLKFNVSSQDIIN